MKRKVVIAGPGSRFLDLDPKWISICYWPQNFESAKRFHFLENTLSLEERKFTTRNRKHGFDWNWWDPEGWNIASVEKKCQHQPLTVLMQTTIWCVDRRFPHLLLVTADPGVIKTCRQDSSHAALSLDCLDHLGEFLPRARYLPVWLQIQSPTLSIWPLGQSVIGMKRHLSCFVVNLTACKDDDHVLSRKALLSPAGDLGRASSGWWAPCQPIWHAPTRQQLLNFTTVPINSANNANNANCTST